MDTPEHNQAGQQAGAAAEAGACARAAAAPDASPRSVTTGGNITIADKPDSETQAHIDWFAFSVTPPAGETPRWLIRTLIQFLPILNITPTGKGWNGYKERHTIEGLGGGNIGLLAFGGDSQRGSVHVELNAQGCALVQDWSALQAWGELHQATITRIDLAHDDQTGETVSVDQGLQWKDEGLFIVNGRPAKARLIDDLGSGDGRTFYVGQRANGKMLRIYEKGKQLGDPSSPWVRVEVELRNKNRLIPWDTLMRPGVYLAGAYPCLAYLSSIQEKIKTIGKAVKISIEVAVGNLRQTGGKMVNLMMEIHSGDAFAVIDELKRDGFPNRFKSYAAQLPDMIARGEL
jgi:DNA relaxase NicK